MIKPATGRLGVLVVGVGGAVATTMITGVLAARKGLAKAIGSITQMATMKMQDGKEHLIKDIVPLTDLNDIVFGGWDIFADDAYEAAMYAEVLKEKDLNLVKDELKAIRPMTAAFDHNFAKRLNGTHIKSAATRWDMVEQLRQDIREFKAVNGCERIVVLWAASTEIFVPLSDEHMSLEALEKAMKENNTEVISPSMCYAYAAIAEGAPFVMGAPNLCVDTPAMWEFSKKMNVPIAGKDFKSGQTLMKTVLAPMFKTRMRRLSTTSSSLRSSPTSMAMSITRCVSITIRPARTTRRHGTISTSLAGWVIRWKSRSTSCAAIPFWPHLSHSTWYSSVTWPCVQACVASRRGYRSSVRARCTTSNTSLCTISSSNGAW